MKLLQQVVNEQFTPQLLDLTMKEIINAGKCQNAYHIFALGKLVSFFKDGLKSADLHLETPVSFNSNETSTSLKASLVSLSDQDHVALATYLLACLKAGECALHDKSQTSEEWISFVLQRQR